jgi:hypothetical protein
MVSGSISLPLPGFFSPFPHGTCALSVAAQYLALDRGRPRFRQGFSCPAVLRYRIRKSDSFRVRGFHTVSLTFPGSFRYESVFSNFPGHPHAALQPHSKWFGLLRVRSPLLAESLLISVPVLLRWFTSHSLAPLSYFIRISRCTDRSVRVTPFGSPRIREYLLLPAAYRSLSRPSSPGSSIGIRHGPIFRLTILLFPLGPSCAASGPFNQASPPATRRSSLIRFPSLSCQRTAWTSDDIQVHKKTFSCFLGDKGI